jgi:general secretion pathway protein H
MRPTSRVRPSRRAERPAGYVRVHPVPMEECAIGLLCGACPCRKTGTHPGSSPGQAFSGTCARASQRGIILLDVVLALALLALLMLVALPILPRGTSAARQAAYTQEIAAILKLDRTAASRIGREVSTNVDVGARRIASGSSRRVVALPRDVTLDVVASNLCTSSGNRFSIVFGADGRSCGAVISIAMPQRDWRIRVNWLTGWVDVVPPGKS